MRDSFIIYRSFYEAIADLPETDQAAIWMAICEYSLDFKEPELKGMQKTIFTLIKPQLDANIKKYENGCRPKKKRNGSETEAKQKQNGSETEAKRKRSRSKAEANVNDNDNDNQNVNQNDNDNQNHLGVMFPFDSSEFKSEWELWCEFRKENGWKKYAAIGEQAALSKLAKLANGDERKAIAVIRQSIENNWKGFFDIKNETRNNGGVGIEAILAHIR